MHIAETFALPFNLHRLYISYTTLCYMAMFSSLYGESKKRGKVRKQKLLCTPLILCFKAY